MQESAGDQRKGRSKVIKHQDKTDSVIIKNMLFKLKHFSRQKLILLVLQQMAILFFFTIFKG